MFYKCIQYIYIHAYLYNNVCQKVLVVQLYGYGKWRHVHLQFCPYFCACTFIVSVRIIILVFLFLSYNSKMCCIFGVQVFKQTNFSIFKKLDPEKNEQSSWTLSITVTKAIIWPKFIIILWVLHKKYKIGLFITSPL